MINLKVQTKKAYRKYTKETLNQKLEKEHFSDSEHYVHIKQRNLLIFTKKRQTPYQSDEEIETVIENMNQNTQTRNDQIIQKISQAQVRKIISRKKNQETVIE